LTGCFIHFEAGNGQRESLGTAIAIKQPDYINIVGRFRQKEEYMVGKKGLLLVLSLIVLGLFITVGARNASSTVVAGKHDLSDVGGAGAFGYPSIREICVFCHTPHGSNSTQTYDPLNPRTIGSAGSMNGQWLWNRALPNRTWQVYNTETYDANKYSGHDTNNGQPGTLSLMCLSCHDGVAAMNVMINNTNDDPNPTATAARVVGNQFGEHPTDERWMFLNIGDAHCPGSGSDTCTSGGDDLRNDHPIGFDYDADVAPDGGLNPSSGFPDALKKRMVITKNRMECSTCHDPHLTNVPYDDTSFSPTRTAVGNRFLVVSMVGSELCLKCHNK
jgi:hypothetical protein